MRVLAIDPGSSLGWATDATGRLEWGTEDFHVKRGESSGNRWRRFGEWLCQAAGMTEAVSCRPGHEDEARKVAADLRNYATDRVAVMIPAGVNIHYGRKVDLIVYEQAHFMPKARAAAEIAAGFTTRLEEHCERHGIALQPVPVQTLKAFALPKVKRKKGDPLMDRGKAAMIAAAIAKLNPLGLAAPMIFPKPGDKCLATLSEHEADALWLYWWARENCK